MCDFEGINVMVPTGHIDVLEEVEVEEDIFLEATALGIKMIAIAFGISPQQLDYLLYRIEGEVK